MKKRILSLVLCAAMLLSMCLFLGAGVTEDTTADGSAESTESYVPAVNFTNVAPFVQANAQMANGPARAPLRASTNDGSTTPTDPAKDKDTEGLVTTKTAEALGNDEYKITLTSYTTGDVKQQQTSKPTDIVLVLDQSGSMSRCIVCGGTIGWGSYHTTYTEVNSISNSTTYYIKNGSGYTEVTYCNGEHYGGACSGGPGWYTSTYKRSHTSKNIITPKDSTHPNGTQFFERSEEDCSSRLSALKKAVTTFVDQVSKEATENNVDHRIAIVGFASTNEQNYNNTELLSTSKVVNYGAAKGKDYEEALVSVNGTNGSINSRLTTAIDRLDADGDTYSEYGIDMANKIFAQHGTASEAGRQRVVVMFTDGYTAPYDSNYFKYSMADAAIKNARTSKSTYKATVYTVGIFANADPSADITENFKPSDGWSNNNNKNNLNAVQELAAANRYMHYASSNYPDATSLNSGGSLSDKAKPFTGGDSYYLSAGDAATLNSIFKKISDNISTPSIELGTQAYVQDTVSDYFAAPADGNVTVTTEKAYYENGNLRWKKDDNSPAGLTHTVTDKTVKVSGFDYDVNFVSASDKGRDENNQKKPGSFYGRRLVVTFTVKAEPGFLGGNNVPTNDATSGVYDEKGTLVENFDYPRVNVPINTPELTSKDANVYYGGDVPTAEELCTTGTIGKKMDDYVDITYSVKDQVSNTTDDTYNVTMTVSPKYSGENVNGNVQKAQTKTVTSTVNVYKPEVTFKDSIIDYNATPDYEKNNLDVVVWKHGNEEAANAKMTGTAPTLTYTYAPEASAFTQDTGVKVTVSANGKELPKDVVTFHHDSCTFPGCKYTDDCGYQFYVHINVFDLTIKKTAANGSEIDQNQTFVFHVKGNNNGVDMQVVITGPGKQVIKNLPVGEYTITEDTSWSWKYTPVDGAMKTLMTSDIENGAATVTFENKNNGTNWLTSLAQVINTWATGKAELKK